MTETSTEDEFDFEPLFDLRGGTQEPESLRAAVARPDSRQGVVYRLSKRLHLAVEVAMTTGRPLLLRGDPGTGKSSLAPYLARTLGWRYYEHVVTSTALPTDLLWRFDAVRRLADAQATAVKPEADYVDPGPIWWALNRRSASNVARASGVSEPQEEMNAARDPHRAIVLIDEIDKAHPDLPNGLLVALGSNEFSVPFLPTPVTLDTKIGRLKNLPRGVEIAPTLVVVTTNEERELPPAFVRRCITFWLTHPCQEEMVEIARTHFGTAFTKADANLAAKIAARVDALRLATEARSRRPSTAEFLDAFRACRKRKVIPDDRDPRWGLIEQITLSKSSENPDR